MENVENVEKPEAVVFKHKCEAARGNLATVERLFVSGDGKNRYRLWGYYCPQCWRVFRQLPRQGGLQGLDVRPLRGDDLVR